MKLTHVGSWARVEIASRIVSYRNNTSSLYFYSAGITWRPTNSVKALKASDLNSVNSTNIRTHTTQLGDCYNVRRTDHITDNKWQTAAEEQTHSAGNDQDRGNILYSFANILSMRFRFLASRSFRQISLMPGKWLIFYNCKKATITED